MSSSDMTNTSLAASTALAGSFKYTLPGPLPQATHLMTQAALELHRARLIDYTSRLRYPALPLPHPFNQPIEQNLHLFHKDRRFFNFHQEEPKPAHSYIGLIAMAILSSKEKKLVLSDIYQWILDNFSYFQTRGPGWRNSIRHNLSLNDCFIKAGRSANGKGHYWAIHPANVEDFQKGDFRRRRAQRKVRKHMGLAVPDDEDSPSPPPAPTPAVIEWQAKMLAQKREEERNKALKTVSKRKKRLFDVESLLAPDTPDQEESDIEIDVDDTVINSDEEEKTFLRELSPVSNSRTASPLDNI